MAGLVFAALTATAGANPLLYEIGGGSTVSVNQVDPGLVVHTALNPNLSSVSFTLDDNQWFEFDFFKIWTNETAVNADDLVSKAVSAQLDFDLPDEVAFLNGSTVGFNAFFQGGWLTWTAPVVITTSRGDFRVQLSNEKFNVGLFGINEGECYGATVKAKVKQLTSIEPAPSVPAPASSMLVLVGIGVVGWSRRRLA